MSLPNTVFSLDELRRDAEAIERAVQEAVNEALQNHKRAGNPVADWQDGKVVWIQPDDILVDDIPT